MMDVRLQVRLYGATQEEPTIDQLWDSIGREERMVPQHPEIRHQLTEAGFPFPGMGADIAEGSDEWHSLLKQHEEYESVFHGAQVGMVWMIWRNALDKQQNKPAYY